MKKIISHSDKETKDFAKNFAKNFAGGVIALTGELGAGKTTFTQGFAEGLGIKEKIISPTFVLIRQHENFFHIDLYRLENFSHLGLEEIINNPGNIVLIEWAEKAKSLLPKNTVYISLKNLGENKREITLS